MCMEKVKLYVIIMTKLVFPGKLLCIPGVIRYGIERQSWRPQTEEEMVRPTRQLNGNGLGKD